MSPSFADDELLNSAWYSIEYASLVRTCVRASPEVVAVLTKAMKESERERKWERERTPSLFPRGSLPRIPLRLWRDLTRQWHDNRDAVQGQHATTKKRSQVVGRMHHELLLSPCVQFFSFPASSLTGAVSRDVVFLLASTAASYVATVTTTRRRWRKSIIWENRALLGMRNVRWLLQILKRVLLLCQRRICWFFFSPAGLSSNSASSGTHKVCATSQWQCQIRSRGLNYGFLVLIYLRIS